MSSSSSDLASSTSGVLGFELLQVAPIERASTSKPSPVWYAGGISEKGKVIIVLHEVSE
jgi:hypothetical protein